MDALKESPNNIERIETLRGMAYQQKTDIFKKLMWFSYPGEENWIPLTTDRVKEIHQLNKEGVKPEEIGAVVLEEAVEEKPVSYDYANRSEEHTSELQSLMRNSYAVFCLKKLTAENLTHLTNQNQATPHITETKHADEEQ